MRPTHCSLRFPFFAAVLVLGGCSSVSLPNLHERNYRETRTFTHQAGEVFAASRTVLEGMGFEVETSQAGRGDLVAASRVLPGSAAELSRQRRAVVSVKWNSDAMSEVKIGFWESTEELTANDTAVSSEKLIRGGPLYDSFWLHMREALPLELPPSGGGATSRGSAGA